MKTPIRLFALALAAALTASVAASQVEIRLKDGSRWRGQVNDTVQLQFNLQGSAVPMEGKIVKVDDLYIVVEGTFVGKPAKRTIFKSDIVTMKTLAAATGEAVADTTNDATPDAGALPGGATQVPLGNPNEPGVFVLPLKGMVGEGFRSNEMIKLAEHCDKYGPGQIIVLDIESGGGLAIEMEIIGSTIAEIRKRHRVVAWIKEAISAAAATATNCDEIYFRTTGTLGAMTMFSGQTSAQGEELAKWLAAAGRMMESGGRSRYIAEAMIDDAKLLSYDKDPVTGEVTWYNDLSGEHILSDAKTNLVFTATTAMECGFADGVADTNEQLAKLLNLPKWNEKDQYGREISKEWLATVDKAKEEIPLLFARYDYKGNVDGAKAKIGVQIGIIKDLIKWWDKAPNVCFLTGVPPKETLERQLEELKRAMARMS